jgi:hypothetical protein
MRFHAHNKSPRHSKQREDSLSMSARARQFLRDTKSARHAAQAGAAKGLCWFIASCHSLPTGLGLCTGGSLDLRFSAVSSVVNPSTFATHHCLTVIPTRVTGLSLLRDLGIPDVAPAFMPAPFAQGATGHLAEGPVLSSPAEKSPRGPGRSEASLFNPCVLPLFPTCCPQRLVALASSRLASPLTNRSTTP